MPGDPARPAVDLLVWFFSFPREAVGVFDARHSPRPLGAAMMESPAAYVVRERGGVSSVVPANAGTHNHRRRCSAKAVDQHLSKQWARRMGPGVRRDDGYGSAVTVDWTMVCQLSCQLRHKNRLDHASTFR